MKSIIEKIYESSVSSKYDTTIFDRTNYKNKKLVPSEDENKNFIIARLGRHFSWQLKGRSNKVDDYIEPAKYNKNSYWINVYLGDPNCWESDKHREVHKIGTATTSNIKKDVLRLDFAFGKEKLYVSCSTGVQRTKKLGEYDIEDNPIDKEYKDPAERYKK